MPSSAASSIEAWAKPRFPLTFPRGDDPGAVYLENQQGGLYLEEESEVALFADEFEDLRNRALSQEDSAEFLVRCMKRGTDDVR